SLVETVLSLPSDRLNFGIQLESFLSPPQEPRDVGAMLVTPGTLDDNPPQMRIAGFRNGATQNAITAGMLAGDKTAIAHQLPRITEPRQRTQFGNNANCRQLS